MKILITFLASLVLVACGGSGGCAGTTILGVVASGSCTSTGNSAPTVATGYFIDSAVQGLKYVSGGQSGVTGLDGGFKYEVGQSITFSIGGVNLGTVAKAGAYITPVDLVSGGSITNQQVINITSFLMSLDTNRDPMDGIQISPALQTAAGAWSQTNLSFEKSYNEFSTQVSNLTGLTLPTQAAAAAHLTSTLRCVQSGIFTGTFSGGESGNFGYYSDAVTGMISGAYTGTVSGIGSGAEPVSLDQQSSFVTGSAGYGAQFTGSISSTGNGKFNSLTGSWVGINKSGIFSGNRFAGDVAAKYRISGYIRTASPDHLFYALDIYSNQSITGKLYSVTFNNVNGYLIAGTLTNNQISATASSGEKMTATMNLTTGALSQVVWKKNDVTITPLDSANSGCLLNGYQL